MAVVIGTTTIYRNIIGADMYVNCTAPASFTTMPHVAGVPGGGTHVGALQGEVGCTINSTISVVETEQTLMGIAPYISEQRARIEATMLELTYANLLRIIQQGTGSTAGGINSITVGGNVTVVPMCVAVVGQLAGTNQYTEFVIYGACQQESLSMDKGRATVPTVKVTFEGYMDMTRTPGDRLCQVAVDAL